MQTLNHYTLNTGHNRASSRSEVGEDIINDLSPVVRADGGEIHGYYLSISWAQEVGGAVYTFNRGEMPLVTCGLATSGAAAAEVWEAVSHMMQQMGWKQAHEMPPHLPWLADVVVAAHPAAAEDLHIMGDASRCVAWTIIERIWEINE